MRREPLLDIDATARDAAVGDGPRLALAITRSVGASDGKHAPAA